MCRRAFVDLLVGQGRHAAFGRIALGGIIGAAWFQEQYRLLTVVPFLFAVFWHARSRREAWCVAFAYYLVAARALVIGSARFFEISPLLGFVIVSTGAAVLASAWAVFHPGVTRRGWVHHLAATAGLFAVGLSPPLAALNVPHPTLVAGMWFPGTGVLGIVLLASVAAAMRSLRFGVLPCSLLAAWSLASEAPASTATRSDIVAVNTREPVGRNDAYAFEAHWYLAQRAMHLVRAHEAPVLVLPENASGLWSEPMAQRWERTEQLLSRRKQTVLVGATFGGATEPLWAGVIALGHSPGVYRQRVPMPGAMWRPWSSGAFAPAWRGPGTVSVRNARLGILVCWEIGVPWSVIRSVLEGADVLVGVSNLGWLSGDEAAWAQRHLMRLWGDLFALPAVLAMNGGVT